MQEPLTEEVLAVYHDAYLWPLFEVQRQQEGGHKAFGDFVLQILSTCKTEWDLRNLLGLMGKQGQSAMDQDFWVDPKRVANELIGKRMVVGNRMVTIRTAEGFGRNEGMRPLYRPMLNMSPGLVYCPKFGRTILVVIAVLDGNKKGGRVLIREIEHRGQVISGPSNVAAYLGITTPKLQGITRWLDTITFQVEWLRDGDALG